jgi:hypothetical protein
VVAWVERGEVSGSFDGRTAKPAPGSVVAKSKAGSGRVQLTLALRALRARRRSPAALDLPTEVRAETMRGRASRADVVAEVVSRPGVPVDRSPERRTP